MKIEYYFKDFKPKALTMSYDDGSDNDRRLVGIFNKYGIRGSFHLVSAWLGGSHVSPDEIKTLYKGHEVSGHTHSHLWPEKIPTQENIREIFLCKETLEKACGYIVRGMSYPYGKQTSDEVTLCRLAGMKYSRTTSASHGFALPDDFLYWSPTCHHDDPMLFDLLTSFKEDLPWRKMPLMYVWGHSHDLDRNGNWDRIEKFCAEASGMEDVWYATNIEICDYVTAIRGLELSADGTMIYNPSATAVYAKENGREFVIEGGKTVNFAER